jgi:hypothetical protein
MIETRKANNMYYVDEEWPEDEDENYYWCKLPNKVKVTNSTGELMTIKGKLGINNMDELDAVAGENGILAAGAAPSLTCASEKGAAALALAVAKSSGDSLVRKGKKAKTEQAEQVVPLSPLDNARGKLKEVRAEIKEARDLALGLKGQEFSKELVSQLEKHAEFLEKVFTLIQKWVNAGINKESKYKQLYDRLEAQASWYEKRKKAARQMDTDNKAPKKAKAKGEAKAKASGSKAIGENSG